MTASWRTIDLRGDPHQGTYRGDPADLIDPEALIAALVQRPSWHASAACRGVGPRPFFSNRAGDVDDALTLCARCPVSAECATAGADEPAGLWGGEHVPHNSSGLRRSG